MNDSLTSCFAVIFHNKVSNQASRYTDMANRMFELAQKQPGFLEIESVRDSNQIGITVSYWKSLEDIHHWKQHSEHLLAQQYGKSEGYDWYHLTVCEVLYDRRFNREDHGSAS